MTGLAPILDCAALPFAYSAIPMTVTESHARTFWFPLALTIATLLFFARSFSSYFVCDDFQFLDRINFNNAGEYLTKSWGYNNEYRPFLPYTYALDASIGGSSPYGYHITNTLLHVGCALFVAALAGLAGLRRSTAMLASVIFILNPAAHESVLWISGRPVVLSTFLVLASCYFFQTALRRPGRALWHWIAAYALFILALCTYELAVVTPLLAGFLAWVGRNDRQRYQKHLAGLLVLSGIYGLFWMWFFEFRLTRFPVEYSLWRIVTNLADALSHSFHGSRSLEMAVFYVLLLGSLWRDPRGRRLSLLAMVWFVIAYLPFFPIQGYADRFIYLSSCATAIVLAAAILEGVPKKGLKFAAAAVLLGFFGTGMQNRVTAWREAGVIARAIPLEIKTSLPDLPSSGELVLLNVPKMHKRSYVFLTSLDRAIEREYPGKKIHVATAIDASTHDRSIIFEYSDGHMVRRSLAEVRKPTPSR